MAIVARTALVVGFCTAEEGEDDHCMSGEEAECRKEQGDAAAAQDCADLLAKRQLLLPQQAGGGGGGGEQRMRVWEENEGMPDEVAELSVQFRRRLGWKDDDDHHHHHHHPAATAQPYGFCLIIPLLSFLLLLPASALSLPPCRGPQALVWTPGAAAP